HPLPALAALHSFPTRRSSDLRQAADIVVGHFTRFALRVDPRLIAETQSQRRPDAVQIAQRNVRRFVRRNVNTEDTRHRAAPLALDRKSTRLNSSHDQISYAVF